MHCQCSRCSKALKRVPALGQYTAHHEMCEIKADIDSRSARGRSMRLEWFAKNDPTMYADLEAVWPDIGRPPLQPRIIVAKHVPAPIHECLHSPTNARRPFRSNPRIVCTHTRVVTATQRETQTSIQRPTAPDPQSTVGATAPCKGAAAHRQCERML
jgi:hypothetical protein